MSKFQELMKAVDDILYQFIQIAYDEKIVDVETVLKLNQLRLRECYSERKTLPYPSRLQITIYDNEMNELSSNTFNLPNE